MSRNTIVYRDRLVPYTKTINEYRAPTDDSIRLLNEMEDKVLERLIARIELKEMLISGVILVLMEGHVSDSVKIMGRFKLNDRILNVSYEISTTEWYSHGQDYKPVIRDTIERLDREIAKLIAQGSPEFLNAVINTLGK